MKRINRIIIIFTVVVIFLLKDFLAADSGTINSADNSAVIFKVMLIVLLTWVALSLYLFYLNRKVKGLEKKLNEK